MLYLIGIGLRDAKDISLKGLEAIKNSDCVYLEGYTSLFGSSVEELSRNYGKGIKLLNRAEVESDFLINESTKKNVALLVIGDPFAATTHSSLVLEARRRGVEVEIIHNVTILSAIGETGLSLYKFGRVVSLVFDGLPESVYNAICENKKDDLHTLCLLDIKADENRFMTINQGIKSLLELEKEYDQKRISSKQIIIGIARLGGKDQLIKSGAISELSKFDFGQQPHCLIIPSDKRHFIEDEWIEYWKK